jgi:hypothetical protein
VFFPEVPAYVPCAHCAKAWVNEPDAKCWHCTAGDPLGCTAGWACKCGFRERQAALDAHLAWMDSIDPGWDR